MQLAGGKIDGHHAATGAVLHDEIDGEILDVELGLRLQRLAEIRAALEKHQQAIRPRNRRESPEWGVYIARVGVVTVHGVDINAARVGRFRRRQRNGIDRHRQRAGDRPSLSKRAVSDLRHGVDGDCEGAAAA